jgi:hypothetical protein
VSSGGVGMMLRNRLGRVAEGRRLVSERNAHTKSLRYRVETLGTKPWAQVA